MRSVVVVLPASMWAMIPMFRVFWRENLRGMEDDPRCWWEAGLGQKNGPLGPTRAAGLVWTGWRRYLLEVSIFCTYSRGQAASPACTRDANPTIAEGFSYPMGLRRRFPGTVGGLGGPAR